MTDLDVRLVAGHGLPDLPDLCTRDPTHHKEEEKRVVVGPGTGRTHKQTGGEGRREGEIVLLSTLTLYRPQKTAKKKQKPCTEV